MSEFTPQKWSLHTKIDEFRLGKISVASALFSRDGFPNIENIDNQYILMPNEQIWKNNYGDFDDGDEK